MKNVIIYIPLWGYPPALGVALYNFNNGDIKLSCGYKTKDGRKYFPGKRIVTKEWAQQFPVITCGQWQGVRIPLMELEKLTKVK